MKVTVQYFDGCPNWRTTSQRLEQLCRDRPDLHVDYQRVTSPEEAERIGFHGSPSIVVDGNDLFADRLGPVGLTCRVYETPDGSAGSPTLQQIENALAALS